MPKSSTLPFRNEKYKKDCPFRNQKEAELERVMFVK